MPRSALRFTLAAALVAASLLPLALLPAARADYDGRGQLVLTGKMALGYDSELVQDDAGRCQNYSAAITGDVSAIATTSVPTQKTAGRTTISIGGLASVSTATLTVVPCYGHLDSTGSIMWIPGAAVTISARSDVQHGSEYGMPKAYVDTDGVAYVKLVPVAITGGGTVRLFARVN